MKKILIILFILMLIISVFQIGDMYAKFKTEIQGEYQQSLGIWSIKLNEVDISSGEPVEIELDVNNLSVNPELVAANKIAPGISGYFELLIDPTDTDVSVIYEIKLNIQDINNNYFKITTINNIFQKPDGSEEITNSQTETNENTHKGIIPIDKINNGFVNFIRVNFNWENSDLNNDADTAIGTDDSSGVNIPIELKIKQYMGETL